MTPVLRNPILVSLLFGCSLLFGALLTACGGTDTDDSSRGDGDNTSTGGTSGGDGDDTSAGDGDDTSGG